MSSYLLFNRDEMRLERWWLYMKPTMTFVFRVTMHCLKLVVL